MISGLDDYGAAFCELVWAEGWDIDSLGTLRRRELCGLTALFVARFAGGWALFFGETPAQQHGETLWQALTRARSFVSASPEWRAIIVAHARKEAGLARARRSLAEVR